MNRRIVLMMIGIMAVLILLGSASAVLAGNEPQPPMGAEKIIGPTMWAVGIIDSTGTAPFKAIFRIKNVEDCEVNTLALDQSNAVLPINNLPAGPGDIEYVRINADAIFGLPCQGIITKVKNFKIDGIWYSFDAQIQFLTTGDETECVVPPQQ